jgi:hypothetical protein
MESILQVGKSVEATTVLPSPSTRNERVSHTMQHDVCWDVHRCRCKRSGARSPVIKLFPVQCQGRYSWLGSIQRWDRIGGLRLRDGIHVLSMPVATIRKGIGCGDIQLTARTKWSLDDCQSSLSSWSIRSIHF